MAVRAAINGFGRTGRAMLRSILHRHLDVEIVAVNDLGSPAMLARLLARDSVHGPCPEPVSLDGDTLLVGDRRIHMLAEPAAKLLPWTDLGVDVVVESTGRNTTRDRASAHLDAGAAHVVVSAPAEAPDYTVVLGVNDEGLNAARHRIVSNASCTTNCLAVLAKVLDDAFGIEEGFVTTVHAYTGDQRLVDALHKDPRRARAAGTNIVPTSTGAARATGLVLEDLSGALDGLALRVPVPDASITDLVVNLRTAPGRDDVDEAYRAAAAAGPLAPYLDYADEPLVSSDIIGSAASCVYDAGLTMVHGRLVKVLGWYDNEMGYSSRLADLVLLLGSTS